MLSETELIELLDQLKFGALTGVVSDTDPVGHWPVLIGDGLCLSLQSAARDEFARQPDKITVVDGISDGATLSSVCASYFHIHHVSTGLHNRSILIGYDRNSLEILPILHDNVVQFSEDYDESLGQSSAAYDFSLAIAASLDPAAHIDGADHPVAFLPLEFEADTRLAGGWRICVEACGNRGEFFIGLLNPAAAFKEASEHLLPLKTEVTVKPRQLCRQANSSELTVTLSLPSHMKHYSPAQVEIFDLRSREGALQGDSETVTHALEEASTLDLMVQNSLQLSADDLYLLLVEAMGAGTALRLRFDAGIQSGEDSYLRYGDRFRCLSINDLPVKHAELVFSASDLTLFVKE